jgi:hypothetical protein
MGGESSNALENVTEATVRKHGAQRHVHVNTCRESNVNSFALLRLQAAFRPRRRHCQPKGFVGSRCSSPNTGGKNGLENGQ